MKATQIMVAATAGLVLIFLSVELIRRVKRANSIRAAAIGSVMLALNAIFVGKPPAEHYIEQLHESKDKQGGESGDPPANTPAASS
ncbi:MAG TPA: hypothetical protein VHX52_06260 [Steroidobacteraceae bacterium]|nr:hypothetical protein [Steroidobacteraceae bacterium]